MQSSRNILVTGFDWYRGKKYIRYYPNPSGLIANMLDGLIIKGYRVRGVELEVSFEKALRELHRLLEKLRPAIIVSLGLSPRTNIPLLEVSSINAYLYRSIRQERYSVVKIIEEGPMVMEAQINVYELYKFLLNKGYSIAVSNTLGTYLCNAVAYTIYYWASMNNAKAIFIHIPPIGDLLLRTKLINEVKPVYNIYSLRDLVLDVIEYSLLEINKAINMN